MQRRADMALCAAPDLLDGVELRMTGRQTDELVTPLPDQVLNHELGLWLVLLADEQQLRSRGARRDLDALLDQPVGGIGVSGGWRGIATLLRRHAVVWRVVQCQHRRLVQRRQQARCQTAQEEVAVQCSSLHGYRHWFLAGKLRREPSIYPSSVPEATTMKRSPSPGGTWRLYVVPVEAWVLSTYSRLWHIRVVNQV